MKGWDEMTSVRDEILEVLNREKIGTMATVENGKPYSRYMTFQNEDFVLYTDEMVTLKIEPIRMRLMNKKGEPPKELEFTNDH